MGSIFLESTNRRDMNDFHTIIYGHRMRSGDMFADLAKYQEEDFWREHPSVYLALEDGVRRLEQRVGNDRPRNLNPAEYVGIDRLQGLQVNLRQPLQRVPAGLRLLFAAAVKRRGFGEEKAVQGADGSAGGDPSGARGPGFRSLGWELRCRVLVFLAL